MPSPTRSDRPLYAELIRRGLPSEYAARTAEELDDHRADLLAELRSTGAADPEAVADDRLGEPRRLAGHIAADYRRRSWFGRWPLISFLLAPVPLVIGAWFGGYALIAVVGLILRALDFSRPSMLVQSILGQGAIFWMLVIVPTLVAYGWGRVALAKTGSRAYALLACGVIGVFVGACFYAELRPSPVPNGGALMVNAPAIFAETTGSLVLYRDPQHLLQYAAPLLAGGLLLWFDHRRRRAAMLASPDRPLVKVAA